MADNDAPVEDIFAGMKKKKKSSKKVVFDEEETPAAAEPAVVTLSPSVVEPSPQPTATPTPAAPAEESTPAIPGDLDFSDLKKKKKKKSVRVISSDGEEEATAPPPASSSTPKVDALGNVIEATGDEAEAGADLDVGGDDGGDEFANLKKLKKKKGSKKAAFDLEAFEKELAEADAAKAGSGGEDDEAQGEAGVGGDEDLEGEDPFAKEDEASTMSKAEKAAEAKAWLKEGDRDYTYEELLGRFYSQLYASHPSLSASGVKRKQTLAPPQMYRDGNKRSVFANVVDICKKMHRSPEHVIQFLFAELGTSGSVDGNGRLVIKGRFQQKQLENVLRRYIMEYVACRTCKSPDTLLTKDNRLFFVTCNSCGSKRTVQAIKTGFAAQIGKRKAQKTG